MSDNGAIFNPEDRSLVISARIEDVCVFPDSGGRITIAIAHLDAGIEIVHEDEELWWPV